MNKIVFNALLVLICVASAGCSSMIARAYPANQQHPEPQYFGGVRADYELVTLGWGSHFPDDMAVPIFCIDMPLSCCADILCLPYDLHTAHAYHTWKAGMTNTPSSTSLGPAAVGTGNSASASGDSSRRSSALAR